MKVLSIDDGSEDNYVVVTQEDRNIYDQGEGIDDSYDINKVGIKYTRRNKKPEVYIKPDAKIFNTKKPYLRMISRSCGVSKETQEIIERYVTIQNVSPDGSCGCYATIVGLLQFGIDVTEDINQLRKHIHDYIQENRDDIFKELKSFRKGRVKRKDEYIDNDVLKLLWNEKIYFNEICTFDYWLHSDSFFPVMSLYFECNFIWFDIADNLTTVCLRKEFKCKRRDAILERKGFVSPAALCEDSVWKKNHMLVLPESLHEFERIFET